MKNLLHRIPVSRKFMLVLALPLCIIVWLAASGIMDRRQVANNMQQVDRFTGLSVQLGGLIHELQVERGLSVGFIGSRGEAFGTRLAAQRGLVDEQIEAYRSA